MTRNYHHITEANKLSLNKLHDSNVLYYSELTNWHTSNAFRSFSIKCVLDGTICYRTADNAYSLSKGELLIASKQSDVRAFFESRDLTRSICIDISSAIINEVYSVLTAKYDHDIENFSNGFFRDPGFIERLYDASSFGGNELINNIMKTIVTNCENAAISEDFFYKLSEQIIYNEFASQVTQTALPFARPSTRHEIFNRIEKGKEYIDQQFLQVQGINEIARVSTMSRFHFVRSFKKIYKITPYQYLLKKRLAYAASLVSRGDSDLTTIAMKCGFPDITSFSKAFKKKYKTCPSKYNLRFIQKSFA